MNRLFWFCFCTALAAVMLLLGWLAPIHLRATDPSVIERAGQKTPTLVDCGLELLRSNESGAAQWLSQAADGADVPEHEKLGRAVHEAVALDPMGAVWGGAASPRLEGLLRTDPRLPKSTNDPLTEFVIRNENQDRVIDLLRASPRPAVHELLQCQSLTNTVVFPPSGSVAGQAFDAAISIAGLLIEEGRMTPALTDWMFTVSSQANRGENSRPMEDALLDLLSLGQRLNWGQVSAIMARIEDARSLHVVNGVFRTAGAQLPVLYSAMILCGKPASVAEYALNFSQTGPGDLAASLRYGAGGIDELVRRNRQVYTSDLLKRAAALPPLDSYQNIAADYALRMPALAMAVKWFFYLSSGFYLAMALHFTRPPRWDMQQPLPARGARWGREILFAMGSLVVVLLLSEPFLAQESQKLDLPIHLHLPLAGSATSGGISRITQSVMDPQSLLTLLLFFVLQALIYTACLVKLAEIRRQRTRARVKLKLLENEEHLFDAGLYLGFAGTIVSLIMVSLGIIKNPSLMAAYSSTAFGIIFVSIFKIFHLRPARRLILMESETLGDDAPPPAPPISEASFASQP